MQELLILKKYKILSFLIFGLLFAGCRNGGLNQPAEINPGIGAQYELYYSKEDCRQRRETLLNQLPDNSIVIVFTSPSQTNSESPTGLFHPSASMYYLTGFYEPNSAAVIRKNKSNHSDIELILFTDRKSDEKQFGPEGAVRFFSADSAYEFSSLQNMLKKYLSGGYYQYLYCNYSDNNEAYNSIVQSVPSTPPVLSVNGYINKLRLIKTAAEIAAIRKSTEITTAAFIQAIKTLKPGIFEYDIANLFYSLRNSNKCTGDAFLPIVASGPNINIIHYRDNIRQMQNGELVMIDYGTEHGFYATDITRTLPVSGVFSEKQRIIYEIVRSVHEEIIAAARPGITFKALDNMFYTKTIDKLLEKGIITGLRDEIISTRRFRQYIPALLGHSVGLVVHDSQPVDASGSVTLAENMIFAFEPHIYLSYGDQSVNPEYWEISARIEDVILITGTGCEILSSNLPYTISGIEALMKQQ